MAEPIARKRLKKKMLDRWENEGGRILTDATTVNGIRPTSESEGRGGNLSSQPDSSTVRTPAPPKKRRKPSQK